MRIKKELKLNRFRAVAIPDNASYFQRFGNRIVESNLYSGDDEVAPQPMRKTDVLQLMDEYDRQRDVNGEDS